jgi:hypothetical protein
MLVSEQVLEIARNLNRTSAEVSAQSIPLLNAWQREWNTRWPYAEYLETSASFVTTAYTQTYTLSANVDKPYAFWLPTKGYRLDRLTDEQIRALGASAVYSTPTGFAPFGDNQVNLYPVPDGAISVYYTYYQALTDIDTSLALSTQTLVIGTKYHDAGVWYATWRLAQRMGDVETLNIAKTEYETAYDHAKRDMVTRVAGTNRVRFAAEQISSLNPAADKAHTMFWGEQ